VNDRDDRSDAQRERRSNEKNGYRDHEHGDHQQSGILEKPGHPAERVLLRGDWTVALLRERVRRRCQRDRQAGHCCLIVRDCGGVHIAVLSESVPR